MEIVFWMFQLHAFLSIAMLEYQRTNTMIKAKGEISSLQVCETFQGEKWELSLGCGLFIIQKNYLEKLAKMYIL